MSGNHPPSRSSAASNTSTILYTNAVYYANYRIRQGESQTPASLNYDCISHVFYAFATVSTDGSILLGDEFVDAQMPVDGASSGCLGSFMRLKQQYEHLRVILSIGGTNSNQDFAVVASTAAARDTFGRSAKGLLDASGLDGIDINWQHPSDPEQGRNFLALLAAVRLYLPPESYILTAALPAGQWAMQNIDLYQAQEYLDFVNLIAYDFAGSWSFNSGHQAQLYPANSGEDSGSAGVDYLLSRGFPPSKIVLGVPVYGRSFLGANGPGQPFSGPGGRDGTFEYRELPRPGAEEAVDSQLVAAFSTGGDGGFVSYDNAQTVVLKANYCRQKGLKVYLLVV
ncbi:glycoside hydrolase [Xylogone sp. PMI_703]|nr:glycoside hydrolase [Xylogone sp. PMI_703]